MAVPGENFGGKRVGSNGLKVLNLQMIYIISVHTYGQWNRWGSLMYHTQSKHA